MDATHNAPTAPNAGDSTQSRRECLQTLLEAIPHAVLRVDATGVVLDYRPGVDSPALTMSAPPIGRNLADALPPEGAPCVLAGLERCVADGEPQTAKFNLSAGVNPHRIEARVVAVDERELLVVLRDLTDASAPRDLRRLKQFTLENVAEAVYWIGPDARLQYVNASACRSLGYERDELLRLTVHDIDPVFTQERWATHWEDLKRRRSFTMETEHRRKDGTLFAVEIAVNYIQFEGREYNCAFAHDITSRKQVEAALRQAQHDLERRVDERTRDLQEANRRLREEVAERRQTQEQLRVLDAAVQQATDGIAVASMSGVLLYVNAAWAEAHGYRPKELIGNRISIFHSAEQFRQDVQPALNKVRKRGWYQGRVGHVRRNGQAFSTWMNTILLKDDNDQPIGVLGIARDITEREQSEKLLRIQRDLSVALGLTDDLADAMAHVMDAAFQIEGVDCGGLYMFDETTGRLELKSHRGLSPGFVEAVENFAPDSKEAMFVRSGQATFLHFDELPCASETTRAEGLRAVAIVPVLHKGEAIAAINFGSHTRDAIPAADCDALETIAARIGSVIARVQAENALRASEKRYRDLVESQRDLIVRFTPDGCFTFVNDIYARVFDRTREELLGRRFYPLVHPDDQAHSQGALERVKKPPHRTTVEQRVWTVEGWRWMSWEYYAVRGDDGEITEIQGIGRDVTRQKVAEQEAQQRLNELAHVTRLSDMGEMASSLAHELNQPLSAIANYLASAVRRLKSGEVNADDLSDDLQPALEQTRRAGDFVRHMKDFIRKREPQRSPMDVNGAVQQAVGLLENVFRKYEVALEYDLADGLPLVSADRVQIQQVIINLARNGVDSMRELPPGETRELLVRTRRTEGGRVEIAVVDTGRGLSRSDCERVFSAFYTTKPNGTGLGLSISRSIVEAHGGRFSVTPHPLRGAIFRFTLPACSEDDLNAFGADSLHR